MAIYDVGDVAALRYKAYTAAGAPTTATVALTVTDPAGATSTPSITFTSPNIYDAVVALNQAGTWFGDWAVSGNVTDAERVSFYAANPAPPTYASLEKLKNRLDETSTTFDDELHDALTSATADINTWCSRVFWADKTATTRRFYPVDGCLAKVHDFYTTTGLVIATDTNNDGTADTTWTSSDYQLEPLDGVVDGEPGWPYWKIRAVGNYRFPTCGRRAPLYVTARWGWPAVPANVEQACLILAAETFKLREAPFGVASFADSGLIRLRQNGPAVAKLAKYRRDPVKVG